MGGLAWTAFKGQLVADVEISQAGWLAEHLYHSKGEAVGAEEVRFAIEQATSSEDDGLVRDGTTNAVLTLLEWHGAEIGNGKLRSGARLSDENIELVPENRTGS